jgi:hypothetical protein
MGVAETLKAVAVAVPEDPAAVSLDIQQWRRRGMPDGDLAAENFGADDKAEAERRFAIIEPLFFPNRFPEIWRDCAGRKLAVVSKLAARHGCKARTIRRWAMQYKRHGVQGLVNRDRSDKGVRRKLNKAARELIRALAIPKSGVFGTLSGSEMFRAYEEERAWRDGRIGSVLAGSDVQKYAYYLDMDGRLLENARLPRLSCKTLRACVSDIPEAVRTLERDGEEAYRNTQEIISHRAIGDIGPLEFCVMDHRLLDVFARVPVRGGWKLACPWLTAAIDFRTRRWLGWGLFEVLSSDSIATVLKKVFIEYGVPQNAYFDHGRDFTSEFLEGKQIRREQTGPVGELDPTWRGVLGTLGVRVVHAIVRNARAKIIEPNFTRVANFDKQLPEYCGHRPSERPERFGLMVKQHEAWVQGGRPESPFRTIQEMAALYDAALLDLNERPLQGEGMKKHTPNGYGWKTPAECWDELIPHIERRTGRTEDFHIVFSKRRELIVKHGEVAVSFGGERFHYRLEGEPTQLMALNGQLIQIAYDPQNLQQVAVYWRDRFCGLAHCIPLRKMGEDLFVADEKQWRAMRRDIKARVKAIHDCIPVASPEERLTRRREILPARLGAFATETAVQFPSPIADAIAAERAEAEFSFADAAPLGIVATEAPAADDSDEFHFFEGER